ncbi:MAG: hypothetical protein FK730_08275 [Asgard group archaeon]|nr:hypothetical protein [Asgard group archaeon]
MKKEFIGVIVIGIVAIGISGGFAAYYLLTDSISEFQDFELGFDGWVTDRDVPMDPNNPGYEVNWSITRIENASRAYSGTHSLKLFIDGRQDDGVIWIEKNYTLEANKKYRVSISFQFYCGMVSFNTITLVVGYSNATNPEVEADFNEGILGTGEEALEWKEYNKKFVIKTGNEGTIWIAVGMSVIWETEVTHYLDDLLVKIK